MSRWPRIVEEVPNPQCWRFAFQKTLQQPARRTAGLQSACLFTSSGRGAARQLEKGAGGRGVDLELAPLHSAFQSRLGDTLNKPSLLSGVSPSASGGTGDERHELLMLIQTGLSVIPAPSLLWVNITFCTRAKGSP